MRCWRCKKKVGSASSPGVEVAFSGHVLGTMCEPCEEAFMVALSTEVPAQEGAEGLAKWRKEREQRPWRQTA